MLDGLSNESVASDRDTFRPAGFQEVMTIEEFGGSRE
jgi:hypothetical protein